MLDNPLNPQDLFALNHRPRKLRGRKYCAKLNSQQNSTVCYSKLWCLLRFDVYPPRFLALPRKRNREVLRSMRDCFLIRPVLEEQ